MFFPPTRLQPPWPTPTLTHPRPARALPSSGCGCPSRAAASRLSVAGCPAEIQERGHGWVVREPGGQWGRGGGTRWAGEERVSHLVEQEGPHARHAAAVVHHCRDVTGERGRGRVRLGLDALLPHTVLPRGPQSGRGELGKSQ